MNLYDYVQRKNVLALYDYGIKELDAENEDGDFSIEQQADTTVNSLAESTDDDMKAVAAEIIRLGAVDAEDDAIEIYAGTHDGEDVTIFAPSFWD